MSSKIDQQAEALVASYCYEYSSMAIGDLAQMLKNEEEHFAGASIAAIRSRISRFRNAGPNVTYITVKGHPGGEFRAKLYGTTAIAINE